MKLQELISEGELSNAFNKGNRAPLLSLGKDSPEGTAGSPFDSLSSLEAKRILGAVLTGKPLDANQKSKLQQIYKKL